MLIETQKFRRNRPKLEGRWVIDQQSGEIKKIRVRVNLPSRCKTAKRICIVCKKTAIHKLDANFEKKICKRCDLGGCPPEHAL